MRTALDVPAADLDEDELSFVAAVREHGWFRTSVLADADGPGFCFTTGFWVSAGFPEIMLFSLGEEAAHDLLWDLYRDVKAGAAPPIGAPTRGIVGNGEAALIPVDVRHYDKYLGWSRWFYGGDDFPCLQLVWPDTQGRFPWQPSFEERFSDPQPVLGPVPGAVAPG